MGKNLPVNLMTSKVMMDPKIALIGVNDV